MVPFCRPDVGEAEARAVGEVLASGWLSRGPRCQAFEEEFARVTGVAHAVSLSSCSAALHLALLAHGIGPGDRVAVPTMTWPSTVNAVIMAGATPVFVDCRVNYVTQFRGMIRGDVRAVIGVDMHGLPFDAGTVPAGPVIIRDAAHSLGAPGVGNDGLTTCYSFYATKNITTGDGGMLTTEDPRIAEKVRRLSLFGLDQDAWKRHQPGASVPWDIPDMGFKANLTDLQAAIGLVQLGKLEEMNAGRRRAAFRYERLLADLEREGRLITPMSKPIWHVYAIRVPDRDAVAAKLKERGIGCGVHFRPCHQLAYLKSWETGRYPMAETLGSQTLSLPLFPGITVLEQLEVVRVLGEVLRENDATIAR